MGAKLRRFPLLKSCKHGADTCMTLRVSTSFNFAPAYLFASPQLQAHPTLYLPHKAITVEFPEMEDMHTRISTSYRLLAPLRKECDMTAAWNSDPASFSALVPGPERQWGSVQMLWAPGNSKRLSHLCVHVLSEFATMTMHCSVCLGIKKCGWNPRTSRCIFKLQKRISPIPWGNLVNHRGSGNHHLSSATGHWNPHESTCHWWSSVGCLMKNGRAISALQIKGPFIYYYAPLRVSINFFSQSKFTGNRQFRIYACNDGYMGH